MNQSICPHCGHKEEKVDLQQFCSKCGHVMGEDDLPSKQQNKPNIHTNTTQLSSKQANRIPFKKTIIVPAIIIISFLIGLFASSTSGYTEEEIVITQAKTSVALTFVSYLYINVTELDLEFTDIDAVLVKKESDNEPGVYEVTGEVIHNEVTFTFAGDFLIFDGNIFSGSNMTLDDE